MEKIVGKTRATDKCSAHAVKQPCRHRDPGLVPADGRYLVIYDREKNRNASCPAHVTTRTRAKIMN